MIPHSIKRTHLLRAIRQIGRQGVPSRRRSTVYDLLHNGKKYPPKYVISVAHTYIAPSELRKFKGGPETNNFLIARGFLILDKDGQAVAMRPVEEDDATNYWEGRALYSKHRRLERDSRLARLVKQRRRQPSGDLLCEACGFSFWQTYGPPGAGFIEAHHTKPVSQLKGRTRVKPEDIALVCSNCHRILHRTLPCLSIEQLRAIVKVEGRFPKHD